MAIDFIYDPKATTIPVLRYVVAVADQRHFGRAAAAAQVSQPTLSALIAQWEKRMKIRVFERNGHGVQITPAGERVIVAARHALAAIAAVEAAVAEARPPFFGPVRLGVIPTVAPYALPFVIPALEKAYPNLELSIREGTTDELLQALDQGRIDVAMLAELPGMAARFTTARLYHEPFVVALPRGHHLSKHRTLSVEALAHERLLLLDEGHCLREQALSLCQRRVDVIAGADYRATSLETLRQVVATGAGITVLPVLAADRTDRRVLIRPFATTGIGRDIIALWRSTDTRAEAYRLFVAPIRAALPAAVRL